MITKTKIQDELRKIELKIAGDYGNSVIEMLKAVQEDAMAVKEICVQLNRALDEIPAVVEVKTTRTVMTRKKDRINKTACPECGKRFYYVSKHLLKCKGKVVSV